MLKRFLVVGFWRDKKLGTYKTSLAEISEGVSKAGDAFGIADTDRKTVVDGQYHLGEILSTEMNLTPEAPAAPARVGRPPAVAKS